MMWYGVPQIGRKFGIADTAGNVDSTANYSVVVIGTEYCQTGTE